MAARILDGEKIAATIKAEVAEEVKTLTAAGIRPGLAVILVGNTPASEIYVRGKVKSCEALGIYSEKHTPPDTSTTDELANTIVVVDRGEVIASGTPDQLKDQVGGDLLEFTVPDRARLDDAVHAVAGLSDAAPTVETDSKRVKVAVGSHGSTALVEAVRRLDAAGVDTEDLALHRPSLDDVFLAVTGHAAEVSSDGTGKAHRRASTGVPA